MTPNRSEAPDDVLVIQSEKGIRVEIAGIGASILSIRVSSPQGPVDIVLSYAELSSYLTDQYYLGSTVGAFANRIGGATFSMDGVHFQLDSNDADRGNCLHGGINGFHQHRFSIGHEANGQRIRCTAQIPDMANGFPGNRNVEVTYELADDSSLTFEYTVVSDKGTIVSMANHAYFNFGGPIDEHKLRVFSDTYIPVSDKLIPTRQLRNEKVSWFATGESTR